MKNEAKVFALCNDATHNLLHYHRPYEINGHVIATDSMILLRVDKGLCEGDYSRNLKGKDLKIAAKYDGVNNYVCSIPLSEFCEALKHCDFVHKRIKVGEDVECKECDGTGEVAWEYVDRDDYRHHEDFDCPICDGTGYERRASFRETDEVMVASTSRIMLNNVQFFAPMIETIVNICVLLDVGTLEFLQLPTSPGDHTAVIRLGEGITLAAIGTAIETVNADLKYTINTPKP